MSSRRLVKHLQDLVQNSSETKEQLSWADIMEEINQKTVVLRQKSLKTVCQLLLDAFVKRPCDDWETALRMMVLCDRYLTVTVSKKPEYDVTRLSALCTRKCVPLKSVEWVLAPVRVGRCIYTRARTRDRQSLFERFSVPESAWIALVAGDWKFLRALVQYGFWDGSLNEVKSPFCINLWKAFIEFWVYAREMRFIQTSADWRESHSRRQEMWNKLQESDGRMSVDSKRGFRRIPLILKMLQAVFLQPQYKDSYLECLRLYFSVLPDPLVSVEEVQQFLMCIPEEDMDRSTVDSTVNHYAKLFGQQPFEPRTLAHQCRYTIRRRLTTNKSASLPKLVEDLRLPEGLRLPEVLKGFILGNPERKSW